MWGQAGVEGAGPPWVNPHYLPMSWPGHISQHYPPTPPPLPSPNNNNDDVNVNVNVNVCFIFVAMACPKGRLSKSFILTLQPL